MTKNVGSKTVYEVLEDDEFIDEQVKMLAEAARNFYARPWWKRLKFKFKHSYIVRRTRGLPQDWKAYNDKILARLKLLTGSDLNWEILFNMDPDILPNDEILHFTFKC